MIRCLKLDKFAFQNYFMFSVNLFRIRVSKINKNSEKLNQYTVIHVLYIEAIFKPSKNY